MAPLPSKLRSIAVAGLLAAVTAITASPAHAAASHRIAVGVTIADAPDQMAPLRAYDRSTGSRPAIVMWYQNWSEPLFYSDQMANVAKLGTVPMITWVPAIGNQGISMQAIADGSQDAYLETAAQAAAAWGRPIYIRFGHEMNLSSSAFGPGHAGDTPATYKAAWRHIVTIFRQAGANNVEWVWSPNVNCGGACPFTRYYPGNRWVDWVGLDGYNYFHMSDSPWMTFGQIFGDSYRTLTRISNKPVMITEIGSAGPANRKANWISSTFLQDIPSYRRIRAVVWFDRQRPLQIDSSHQSLVSWRHVVANREYTGTSSPLRQASPFTADVDRAGHQDFRRADSRWAHLARW